MSKTKRRTILKGSLALAAAPAIITSARAQEKVSWRLQAHWPRSSVSFGRSLEVLAKELDRQTGGRFRLELFGAGEMAKGGEIFHLVRRGVVQMAMTFPGYNLDESELFGLYAGLPGLLREPWEMMHYTRNLGLEDAVNEDLRAKGVFMRAEFVNPTELVLKRKIDASTNLAGVKVRSAGTMLEFLAAAGFAPQQVASPEIYQALSTGVIDGAHWGAAAGALSLKLWEVAPFHMKPSLQLTNNCYMVNQAAYDKLPEDLRQIFIGLVDQHCGRRTFEYQHEEAVALRVGVEKMGVTVGHYSDEVMAGFGKAAREILAKEMAKGPKAKEFGDRLLKLMGDLGYA